MKTFNRLFILAFASFVLMACDSGGSGGLTMSESAGVSDSPDDSGVSDDAGDSNGSDGPTDSGGQSDASGGPNDSDSSDNTDNSNSSTDSDGTGSASGEIVFTPEPVVIEGDFCPAYTASPVYRVRANTLILGPEMEDWERQIELAPADTEILLRDGEYLLDKETIIMSNPDVTVRSLSGNRLGVVIRGLGYYVGTSHGFMITADRITIADLSMHGMRRHAIAMTPILDSDLALNDVHLYNLNLYDTGTQHIKASNGGKNINTVIACSSIGYTTDTAVGDYIAAIGFFEGVNAHVRDNYIYNINGDGTGCNVSAPEDPCGYVSSPAMYFRFSQDTVVERNWVINSWRGISIGLTNGHIRGIVRNNFVYRDVPGDMGISVELSNNTIVEHNTVIVDGYWAPIQVRAGSGGHVIRNNLMTLPVQLREGAPDNNNIEGNFEFATMADFVAPGDPHLSASSSAIGVGVPTSVTTDIDGNSRSGRWDAGADHYTE